MSNLVKAKIWDTVKDDGRLGYRGSPGIRSHAIALVSADATGAWGQEEGIY